MSNQAAHCGSMRMEWSQKQERIYKGAKEKFVWESIEKDTGPL